MGGKTGVALQPLADRLAELLRSRPVLHADETPLRQLGVATGDTLSNAKLLRKVERLDAYQLSSKQNATLH